VGRRGGRSELVIFEMSNKHLNGGAEQVVGEARNEDVKFGVFKV
jgi:hypothetical protein